MRIVVASLVSLTAGLAGAAAPLANGAVLLLGVLVGVVLAVVVGAEAAERARLTEEETADV